MKKVKQGKLIKKVVVVLVYPEDFLRGARRYDYKGAHYRCMKEGLLIPRSMFPNSVAGFDLKIYDAPVEGAIKVKTKDISYKKNKLPEEIYLLRGY